MAYTDTSLGSSTLKWHLANMWIGPHLITPLYCVVNFPDGRPDSHDALVTNRPLIDALVPLKAAFFFLPVALMHCPGPYNPPDEVKVHLAMLIHTWPVWIAGGAYLLQGNKDRRPTARAAVLSRLRVLYVWAFYAAAASHVVTVLWCLSLDEAPGSALHAMFVPPFPRAELLTLHPREAIYFVTKWANVLCPSSAYVWALVAYLQACQRRGLPSVDLLGVLVNTSGLLVVCGPYAVAVRMLIWKHDVLSG
ncbi:uncharacterized protein BO97DRAFT_423514 [Aspergillus homomorphus CBS 101889]|uniref:Uncharacterized protein n=1 Tax=Aspergillus homomorphus (strain CBS 101889) TaxID=1450537 RepID=A0A395I1W9_ASPHC|nr:hypothetical protein BO97DRAFT_423514 [Aspergillus homomorphus CBS 101889]RAL13735.1 hypothetical protein BO97DRAFT_423514 [Aspergillus homomorphus CBS 101889]